MHHLACTIFPGLLLSLRGCGCVYYFRVCNSGERAKKEPGAKGAGEGMATWSLSFGVDIFDLTREEKKNKNIHIVTERNCDAMKLQSHSGNDPAAPGRTL